MKKHRKPETGFGGAAYIARVSASRIKTLRREALSGAGPSQNLECEAEVCQTASGYCEVNLQSVSPV